MSAMQTDVKQQSNDDRKGNDLVTLQNISPSKLLNYVVKDRLKEIIDPTKYAEIETELRVSLGKSRITLKDIKQYLANQPEFISLLREHDVGAEAFAKYLRAVGRLQNIDRNKATQVRRVMSQPRSRYLGCLATQLQPEAYQHCLDKYDDSAFDNISLIPNQLRQRVYDNGDDQTKQLLLSSVQNKRFSDLPSGLKHYMQTHPSEFKNYFNQRRHELGLMKSVLRNMSSHEKSLLRDYYRRNKEIKPENMFDIISQSRHPDDEKSRKRNRLEPIAEGRGEPHFNDDDWETQSVFSVGSNDTSMTNILDDW